MHNNRSLSLFIHGHTFDHVHPALLSCPCSSAGLLLFPNYSPFFSSVLLGGRLLIEFDTVRCRSDVYILKSHCIYAPVQLPSQSRQRTSPPSQVALWATWFSILSLKGSFSCSCMRIFHRNNHLLRKPKLNNRSIIAYKPLLCIEKDAGGDKEGALALGTRARQGI